MITDFFWLYAGLAGASIINFAVYEKKIKESSNVTTNTTLLSMIQGVALSVLFYSFGANFLLCLLPPALPLFIKGCSYIAKKCKIVTKQEVDFNKYLSRFYEVLFLIVSITSFILVALSDNKEASLYMSACCVTALNLLCFYNKNSQIIKRNEIQASFDRLLA